MDKLIDFKNYIIGTSAEVCSHIIAKCIVTFVYVIYSFAFDTLKTKALIALLFLTLVDFVTGILSAKISGEEITSRKVVHTAIKILVYFIFVASAFVTEHAVPQIAFFCDEVIIAFLALTELISITENIGKLGFAVPKKWLNKLQDLRDKE